MPLISFQIQEELDLDTRFAHLQSNNTRSPVSNSDLANCLKITERPTPGSLIPSTWTPILNGCQRDVIH
ncbi:hypothetical protein M413DRAFT_446480 [Hebeloma cylindrosporum]|uniref:Uncharacterized protein n=1 Tax=Hebeloma cylindrosporum TaxID=76867 RepID=A0A0C2XRL5_HEBCY|nr:hypothetical protein M413DRAFT_446480 [Hebeloma cylindrosporum h7]